VLRRVAAAFVTGPIAFLIAGVIDITLLVAATVVVRMRKRLGLLRG
jgi:hypothetical protein